MSQTAWNVYLSHRLIDTVFFDRNCDKDYVYRCLVNHDGYKHNIRVVKARKRT